MTSVEERLAAYRPVLEDAIERHAQSPRPSRRRWSVLIPMLGAVAAAIVLSAFVLLRADRASAPSAPAVTGPVTSVTSPITAPPSSTVAPSTIATPAPPRVVAIGDNVMAGATSELGRLGIAVDAMASRPMRDAVAIVEQRRDRDELGEVLIVHLGNTGTISDATIDAFFTATSSVTRVVVLTNHVPGRHYADANNNRLRAVPARFPNVVVVDWDQRAITCGSSCLHPDGIHLRPAGQAFYARLIADAAGIADAGPPPCTKPVELGTAPPFSLAEQYGVPFDTIRALNPTFGTELPMQLLVPCDAVAARATDDRTGLDRFPPNESSQTFMASSHLTVATDRLVYVMAGGTGPDGVGLVRIDVYDRNTGGPTRGSELGQPVCPGPVVLTADITPPLDAIPATCAPTGDALTINAYM
jgi:hypothetical protein